MVLDRPAPAAPARTIAPSRDAVRSLRILLLVESAGGGTGRHVLDLADGLIARGHDVHVIYSTGRIDKIFRDRLAAVPGLHSMAVPMRTSPHPSDIGVVRRVRRYMREHGPFDIVHGHSSKGGAIARLAAVGKHRVRAFYTLHGLIMMDPCLAKWKSLMYLTIERVLALRTERIIAVSPEETRAAKKLLGESRIVMVPNGLGPMDLTPRGKARRDMNVDDDALVIGFVGRLVEQKAPHILFEAFARCAKANPHARLAMVGDGPLNADLRQQANELGIADKVIWLGERDARGVLAGFDVFALSSRKEGLPYVVLEAMAAGLPVVATASAGVEILVSPGINGEVVPKDDAIAFGRALTKLATDPQFLVRCGDASLRLSRKFTIDAMVEGTLAAYGTAGYDATIEAPVTSAAVVG
jgi:glycosyltransferase involved in cell wall biosynthesis